MKKIEYLPSIKQAELSKIIMLIKEVAATEMIILFGSYARNDWVEEKYDEEHYRYQSDFDILVIVETKSANEQNRIEMEIEERIEQAGGILTPISIIVHDIYFVNQKLAKAQYFFTDIKKEGVILHDSGKFHLQEPKLLSSKERCKLAKEDFEYWFNNAEEFYIDFKHALGRKSYRNAAFMLHQVVERLYNGILLVFTRYKPKSHDLFYLRALAHSVDSRFSRIFPLTPAENKQLFKLLRKAYIEARYNPNYKITEEQLLQLSKQAELLNELGRSICSEKISQLQSLS